jgi:hypothetical protein
MKLKKTGKTNYLGAARKSQGRKKGLVNIQGSFPRGQGKSRRVYTGFR